MYETFTRRIGFTPQSGDFMSPMWVSIETHDWNFISEIYLIKYFLLEKAVFYFISSQFQEEPPQMKLNTSTSWSHTIFDVILMGAAAKAHGVLLSYSCIWHMIFMWMVKIKQDI